MFASPLIRISISAFSGTLCTNVIALVNRVQSALCNSNLSSESFWVSLKEFWTKIKRKTITMMITAAMASRETCALLNNAHRNVPVFEHRTVGSPAPAWVKCHGGQIRFCIFYYITVPRSRVDFNPDLLVVQHELLRI